MTKLPPVVRIQKVASPNRSPPERSTVASLRAIAGHQRVAKHLRGRSSLATPGPAGDEDNDQEDEVDTRNLDVSLLEKIAACPEGTVLRRVEDWISNLEYKYAGRARELLPPVSPESPPRTVSVYEKVPLLVKYHVRRFFDETPFPSWDGKEDTLVRRSVPAAARELYDYAPDLLGAEGEPEDDEEDDRDAGKSLVRAYCSSCVKRKKSGLPQAIEAISRRQAESLLIPGCSLADGGLFALAPYLGQLVGLVTLDLSANMIFDDGARALGKGLKTCKTLTTLLLDDNKIGTVGSSALALQFRTKKSNLTSLSLRHNQLSDAAVAAIVDALAERKKIVKLVLSHNAVGQQSCTALAKLLQKSLVLEWLECHWGHMRKDGAEEFAEALVSADQLKHLDLGWNGFGDLVPCSCGQAPAYPVPKSAGKYPIHRPGPWALALTGLWQTITGIAANEIKLYAGSAASRGLLRFADFGSVCSKLAEALKSKSCAIEYLDLSHNRLNEQSAFLIAGPLEFNKSLTKIILDGNPLGQSGCRRLMQSCMGFKNNLETQQKDDRNVDLSIHDCSFGIVSAASFDPAEPAGEYLFDMSDPYMRLVVRDLLKIEALGKGQFQRNSVTLNLEPYNLKKITDFDKEAEVPHEGEFSFRFVSLRKPPWAGGETELHETVFSSLMEHFTNNSKPLPGEHRMGKIEYLKVLITADTVFSYEQAGALIVHLLTTEERISFMVEIYHKFNEPDGNKRFSRQYLTESEQRHLKLLLGPTAFAFTPNNPTGHHRLDLSLKEERDIGIKILDARNGNEQVLKEYTETVNARSGGPRDHFELCWLNAHLDGEALHYERHLQMPRHGILELDFVSLLKPQDIEGPDVEAIADKEWSEFLLDVKDVQTLFEAVAELRELSNTKVFKCKHIKEYLRFLNEKCEELRSGPEGATEAKNVGSADLMKYRVEVCIIAFARTLDYLGFFGIFGLYKTDISRAERHMLMERIHRLNMFHNNMAIDYYELDLCIHAERAIMQDIVHLAIVEPGQNCMNETYNDMDFPIPSTWQKEVPRKGLFTCFYCREQDTINNICAKANKRHPGALPSDVQIPALTGWVYAAKCHQIKQKMADKFPNAKSCFKAIDKDGGGTVDRKELAGGLFNLGVWLRPTELKTLFEAVDQDGGGDVDIGEFESFWNKW